MSVVAPTKIKVHCCDIINIRKSLYAIVINTEHTIRKGDVISVNTDKQQALVHRVISYPSNSSCHTYGLHIAWIDDKSSNATYGHEGI